MYSTSPEEPNTVDIEKVTLPGLPPKRAADFKLNAHNGVPFEERSTSTPWLPY